MNENLMEILCCPVCKGDLQLEIEERDGNEIITGKLICNKCNYAYKIEDGIPNLLPPK